MERKDLVISILEELPVKNNWLNKVQKLWLKSWKMAKMKSSKMTRFDKLLEYSQHGEAAASVNKETSYVTEIK